MKFYNYKHKQNKEKMVLLGSLGLERPSCRRGGWRGVMRSRKHEHKYWRLVRIVVGSWTLEPICMADLQSF